MNEKNEKITKRSHAFKGYSSSYYVKILNSELQLKDFESSIRNKVKYLLSELKGFIFTTTLVLEFEKMQSDYKTLCNTFYLNSKANTINKSNIYDAFE